MTWAVRAPGSGPRPVALQVCARLPTLGCGSRLLSAEAGVSGEDNRAHEDARSAMQIHVQGTVPLSPHCPLGCTLGLPGCPRVPLPQAHGLGLKTGPSSRMACWRTASWITFAFAHGQGGGRRLSAPGSILAIRLALHGQQARSARWHCSPRGFLGVASAGAARDVSWRARQARQAAA